MPRHIRQSPRPGDPDPPVVSARGKLQLEPPSQYGPAMQALTPRWRRFVYIYLANGGRNATKAYIEAGFGSTGVSARNAASKLLHDARIQEALREETKARMNGYAPLALHVVGEILDDPTASKKDRLSAAKAIFDRTGYIAQIGHEVKHTHTLNSEQMLAQVKQMAQELGIDPQKLLGAAAVEEAQPLEVIDAESFDVDDDLSDLF